MRGACLLGLGLRGRSQRDRHGVGGPELGKLQTELPLHAGEGGGGQAVAPQVVRVQGGEVLGAGLRGRLGAGGTAEEEEGEELH